MLYGSVSDYRVARRQAKWHEAQQRCIDAAKEAAEDRKRKRAVAAETARREELREAKRWTREAAKAAGAPAERAGGGDGQASGATGGPQESGSSLVGLKEAAVRSALGEKISATLGRAKARVSRRRKSKKPTTKPEGGLATIAENEEEEDRADSYGPGAHPGGQASGWPEPEQAGFASGFSDAGVARRSRKSQSRRKQDEEAASIGHGFGSPLRDPSAKDSHEELPNANDHEHDSLQDAPDRRSGHDLL